MKKVYPSDKQDQYMLRFPTGMRDKLKSAAAKNGRSLNAEIIARLELSYEIDTELTDASAALVDHERRLEQIEERMARMEDHVLPSLHDRD